MSEELGNEVVQVRLSEHARKLLDIASSSLGSSVDDLINSWVLEGAHSLGISLGSSISEAMNSRTRVNMEKLLDKVSSGVAATTAAMQLGMSPGQARAWCLRYPSFAERFNEAKIQGQLTKLRQEAKEKGYQ